MNYLETMNTILMIAFLVCYAYQFFYILVPHIKKDKPHKQAKLHRYAVLICARNEEAVIADLIDSLHGQTYPQDKLKIFVMADNCTDRTADAARAAGATVYERFDREKVGKGYALDALLGHIAQDEPEGFDGYFVFDADNLLRPDYIERMNEIFSDGHDIVTSYRNSKNYGDNWISAGYGLWFLRESEYLNHARMLQGTSCAVSGTGFLFSRKVLREQGGWPFHLLIEDIQFSVSHILDGYKIAFCPQAELFDEQPVTFRQSWRQRMRWSRGYLQVLRRYGLKLCGGMFKGSFSCYDMSMNILPAFVFAVLSCVTNVTLITMQILEGANGAALLSLLQMLSSMYLTLFLIGAITTATQWKKIHTAAWKKILYAFTFPVFMFTYVPISIAAIFTKVQWKPIQHSITAKQVAADLIHH